MTITNEQAEAIENFMLAVSKLRELKVIKSDRFLGDLGEFLASSEFGLALAKSLRQRGHDTEGEHDRVQIKFHNGERTIIDGPFTETKELVGGYAIMQFDSEEQAREWTLRFAKTSGQECVQVRKVFRAEDYPQDLREEAADVFEGEELMRQQAAERTK